MCSIYIVIRGLLTPICDQIGHLWFPRHRCGRVGWGSLKITLVPGSSHSAEARGRVHTRARFLVSTLRAVPRRRGDRQTAPEVELWAGFHARALGAGHSGVGRKAKRPPGQKKVFCRRPWARGRAVEKKGYASLSPEACTHPGPVGTGLTWASSQAADGAGSWGVEVGLRSMTLRWGGSAAAASGVLEAPGRAGRRGGAQGHAPTCPSSWAWGSDPPPGAYHPHVERKVR